MLDIKVLRVRNIAAIKNYDFVTTILVNNVDGILSIRGVQVNNEPVGYVVASADELIVMLPTGISKLDDVYSVVLEREATDGNIREVLLVNTSQLDKTGGSRVSPLHSTLYLYGESFSGAEEVWVNGKRQPFSLLSGSRIICGFPNTDSTIDSIDVITAGNKTNHRSIFSYLLGKLEKTYGPIKATQQFVSCMLSDPDSDAFDDPGTMVGLKNWLSKNVSSSNPQVLHAQIVVAVQVTAVRIIAQQASSSLPPDERIISVQVVGIDSPQENPTAINLLLRIQTLDKQTLAVNSLLNIANQLRSL